MENETEINRLELLERSVERLLNGYNALKHEKAVLEAQIENKNSEIDALQQAISEFKEDKNSTLQRVSGLLSSIEAWEESQTMTEETGSPENDGEEPETGGGIGATLGDPQMSMMSIIR